MSQSGTEGLDQHTSMSSSFDDMVASMRRDGVLVGLTAEHQAFAERVRTNKSPFNSDITHVLFDVDGTLTDPHPFVQLRERLIDVALKTDEVFAHEYAEFQAELAAEAQGQDFEAKFFENAVRNQNPSIWSVMIALGIGQRLEAPSEAEDVDEYNILINDPMRLSAVKNDVRNYMKWRQGSSQLTYPDWMQLALENYQRHMLTKGRVEEVIATVPIREGAIETLVELRSMGYKIGLFTGGFKAMTDRIRGETQALYGSQSDRVIESANWCADLGFKSADNDQVVSAVNSEYQPWDYEGKGRIMEAFLKSSGVRAQNAVVVGDGGNDLIAISRLWKTFGGLGGVVSVGPGLVVPPRKPYPITPIDAYNVRTLKFPEDGRSQEVDFRGLLNFFPDRRQYS